MKRKFTKKTAAPVTAEEVAKKNQYKAIRQRTFDSNNEVARVDTPLTLIHRLFRADVRGERIFKENIPSIEWGGGKIEVKGPELDSFDQDVLYGLLAIGLIQHEAGEEGEPGGSFSELEIKASDPVVFPSLNQLKEADPQRYEYFCMRIRIDYSDRFNELLNHKPEGTNSDEWEKHCCDVVYAEKNIPRQQKDWLADVDKGKLEKAADFETIEVRTSLSQLRKMIGAGRAASTDKAIKASIDRLSAVLIKQISKSGVWGASRLMFGAAGKGRDSISVRFSWRITGTILDHGEAGKAKSYIRMKMEERRQLSPGLPRLLHSYLMARNVHRQTVTVSQETIVGRFYAVPKKGQEITRKATWKRQQAIKEAFAEIGEVLGATITEKGGTWTVKP